MKSDKSELERLIRKYKKIVFFPSEEAAEFAACIPETILRDGDILILCAEAVFGQGLPEMPDTVIRLSEKETEELVRLYSTYEFTDNFIMIAENSSCASVFNFVGNGVLTTEEAWQALVV